ncbi:amidohydrolase family protein [Xylophilus sp.]|uniref:amidohydrolase family protein n=1 Tax=Xylophilus sp. TaxID=2653893 RepID=UPI0013BBF0F7|nr:amidohydrolase family protein [Xylophilus sp.]KAF1046862.1 MAG: 4-sulfomuconolactone hydrolase [Xylophilus sp.]
MPAPSPSSPVQTYLPHPSRPRPALPPGACDAHCHIFGPADRFPYAPQRSFTPVDATREQLFALHRMLGIERCVLVQSAVHGFDNAVIEDAIAAGGGRYLGIALVPVDVADTELQRLAAAGFRGVRFNFMAHLPSADPAAVVALTRRLAPLGLHLQVHFESSLVHTLGPVLAQSAVPVVIDHFGRVDASLGADHADFRALAALLRNPLFHVKLSGADRNSRLASSHRPPYADATALARRLLEAAPERCFWGTDWPHPNHTHIPDDGLLVDALEQIAPTAALRRQLLVDNPQRFYRFIG